MLQFKSKPNTNKRIKKFFAMVVAW